MITLERGKPADSYQEISFLPIRFRTFNSGFPLFLPEYHLLNVAEKSIPECLRTHLTKRLILRSCILRTGQESMSLKKHFISSKCCIVPAGDSVY